MVKLWMLQQALVLAVATVSLTVLLLVAFALTIVSATSPQSRPGDVLLVAVFALSAVLVGYIALESLRSLWYFRVLRKVLLLVTFGRSEVDVVTSSRMYTLWPNGWREEYEIFVQSSRDHTIAPAGVVVGAGSVLVLLGEDLLLGQSPSQLMRTMVKDLSSAV
ncbi:hypothetical protein EOL96_07365 [Candidatus Saccharibacteria bacterium]|nr:hypothetical protein [Candidatus Saccharibacteria bacterium]